MAPPSAPSTPRTAPERRTSTPLPPSTVQPVRPHTVERPPAKPKEPEKPDPVRAEAERLLRAALRRQAALEGEGAAVWGATRLATSYPDAIEVLAQANGHFDRGENTRAVDAFSRAIELFDQLEAGRDRRYNQAMKAGLAALADMDAETAAPQFQLALAVRPGDEAAGKGLARAERLPGVIARLDEARRLEAAGDLDGALKAFLTADEIDPAHGEARRNIDRLQALILDRDYRAAVSRALAAIDREDFDAASNALKAARGLRPAAPELASIGERLRAGRQLKRIRSFRRKAVAAKGREAWPDAEKLYDKILAIDATIDFAIDGKAEAARIGGIHRRIDIYLKSPERLNSRDPLNDARDAMAAANGLENRGPELRRKIAALEKHIAVAATPRPVRLTSDGQTRVTVYRVGRFGALSERRLELRPGRYVAVGTRAGFRDVRVEFRVEAGQSETVVDVRCVERI